MLDLLVIQPTPFCNINCAYCYLGDRSNTQKMSLQTVDKIVDRLLESNLLKKELTVVFHAGEPLVLKPDFYRPVLSAFDRLKALSIPVTYSIQTNGTLITQEWCDLVKEYEIRIGVSVDGPADINDKNRVTRNGKGTFDAVMKGISLLRQNNIRYHGIAVISRASLLRAADIFQFFHDNEFYQLGLNIEEVEGTHTASSLQSDNADEEVKAFFEQMFAIYMASDRKMDIREFAGSELAILREPGTIDIRRLKTGTHQTEPFGIISIDHQGNFSTFSPELIGQKSGEYNDFIIGNVHQSGFREALNSAVLQKLKTDIGAGIDMCKKSCEYFAVCGGGAPANKYYENNTFRSTVTKYCKYHIQLPVNIVLAHFERHLELA